MPYDDVIETIVRAIAPYLGENMARAATRDQCRKLGLGGAQLETAEVESLLDRIGKGLNLFVGRDQAAQLLERVRRELRLQSGAA